MILILGNFLTIIVILWIEKGPTTATSANYGNQSSFNAILVDLIIKLPKCLLSPVIGTNRPIFNFSSKEKLFVVIKEVKNKINIILKKFFILMI